VFPAGRALSSSPAQVFPPAPQPCRCAADWRVAQAR
jgi:hypothetical protein